MYKIIFLALFVSGCELPEDPAVDQRKRQALFDKCLANIPKGPSSVVNNDWDEVVSECSSAAYYQSLRIKSQIPLECRVR